MSSGKPAQAQQITKVELPAWVDAASQANYQLAQSLAARPLEQYGGPTVASQSPLTTQAYDYLAKTVGSGDQFIQSALDSIARSLGYQTKSADLIGKATGAFDATMPYYNKATGYFDRSADLYNQSTGYYNKAADLYGKSTDWYNKAGGLQGEAADIYRSTAGPLDISHFLNPYTAEVEANAIANAERSLSSNLLGVSDAADKASAFGGSRHAIESALTRSEGIRNIGDLSAELRRAGIDFATSTAIADRVGRQAAGAGLLDAAAGYGQTGAGYGAAGTGLLNVGAGYGAAGAGLQGAGTGFLNTAAGLRDTGAGYLSGASGLLDASTAARGSTQDYLNTLTGQKAAELQDISSLFSAGQSQQAYDQSQIDALMRQFYERRDYPIEALNMQLAALGMSPYGRTETGTKTGTSERLPTDWATLGLGALKTIPALVGMSDRNMKTDIEKLTGGPLPLYSYRYKGDPKSYPKVVGPMAQDVEKVVPSAVKKIGGRRVIDYSNLMEVLS